MIFIKYIIKKINNLNEFGFYIFFIQILHKFLYGRNLNSRVVQFLSEERLKNYLDKYCYVLFNNESKLKKQKVAPKEDIIWTMWLQGENNAPILIRKCIDSIREKCNDKKVVVLDENNICDFIDVPNYIKEKYNRGYITRTHFSDIIRLLVLYKYGGCWIDSTVFLSNPTNDLELSIKKILELPFFMVKAPLTLNQFRISSSWIIRSYCNDPIITSVCNLLLEYWKNERYMRAYFLIHLCFAKVVEKNKSLKQEWDAIPYFDDSASNYLRTCFGDEYSFTKWKNIKNMTSIHKLNWKLCKEGGCCWGGKGSFCDKFLKGELK